jgi:hypothetical protein
MSPALNSLKEIQLYYSGVETAAGGKDTPLSVKFKQEVRRYAGDSESYDEWSKVLVFQNERGLMVETLKIAALELALQEREYRQYERMEALLAALVAQEVNATAVSATSGRAGGQEMQRSVQ